ncbi:BON domain-containing protein [Phenylobacterium sp.]|uniref:BON domain-containing protein n=1 Tax=Phenylobacterium sp. TaxID=1871053 RepID=UPI00301CF3D1
MREDVLGYRRDLEAERLRRLRDRDDPRYDRASHRDDYGQADYSERYGYDPRTRSGYRVHDDGRSPYAGGLPGSRYVAPRDARERDARERDARETEWERRRGRRDGPSDRVLWAVVTERLDAERRLDLRDVEVDVIDGEVILDGTVRHKADKRRIEDVADIDGVRNVQNNLRVRERGRWTFL